LGESIKVYPNPASRKLYIQSQTGLTVTIAGMDGKIVLTKTNATDIEVSTLADGIYMLRIEDARGSLLGIQKLTKID